MKLVTVMHVDDDEIDRMNLARSFKAHNIANQLIEAGDGEEALRIIRGDGVGQPERPYIILLDLNMPRMNGLEFLAEFRSDKANDEVPVIVLTSSQNPKDLDKAHALGISGYIIKPVRLDDFTRTMGLIGKYWALCEFP